MNLQSYLLRKSELQKNSEARGYCFRCRHPSITCYCATIKPFSTSPRFLILMHPHEVKKTIGTGRMAHQCLKNSTLWVGSDFQNSPEINNLLNDSSLYPVLLFPGPQSINLNTLPADDRMSIFPKNKTPIVIVLDATWIYATKMLYRSPNLQTLPRIMFDPPHLSKFLLRKQPSAACFSTIEAIHEVINLFSGRLDRNVPQPQDHLMEVFEGMVNKQLAYRRSVRHSRHRINYYKRKGMVPPVEPPPT